MFFFNHFSRAVLFSHSKKFPCLGPTLGTFSRAIFGQAHKRAIQAAAPGDLAALGLKL